MVGERSVLAVIPARGGSKRLPGKNIMEVNGKPMLAYSIEAALESPYIDRVVVTSDDDAILAVAVSFGAESIKRPAALATDEAASFDAIRHAVASAGFHDVTVLLQPTSPLRSVVHIDGAFELFAAKGADAVVSVCKTEHSPLWSNTLGSDMCMDHFIREEVKNVRSQDLPTYYRLNGAIYIADTQKALDEGTFFLSRNIYAFEMAQAVSVDIDEAIDLELVSLLMRRNGINA